MKKAPGKFPEALPSHLTPDYYIENSKILINSYSMVVLFIA